MEYLQILRMWIQLERCAAGVRRLHDQSATTVSVTSSGPDTYALNWRSDDPLAVRVTMLVGLGCSTAVVSRDALRATARAGFTRSCRLNVGARVLRISRHRVRQLLAATDALVPPARESVVVQAAASRFLHSLLGPVAPRS